MSMIVKFVRDDNKIFTLGGSYRDYAAWGITEISGLGMIQNTMTKEDYADMDGVEITGDVVPVRNIDITCNVKNAKNNNVERNKALSFFNPKHLFNVYVKRDSETRWISARVENFNCPDTKSSKNIEMQIALVCPDPYFNSQDNYGKNIAAVTGTFGFPYISPVAKGFAVGRYNFAKQVEVMNNGDMDTYSTIIIEAFGLVENPKIIQNNIYIRLIDTLKSGDAIEIDLVANTIKKNGMNCIGKVDRTSSFTNMRLCVGENLVSFDADNGDTNMKVTLYYNLRYLGA